MLKIVGFRGTIFNFRIPFFKQQMAVDSAEPECADRSPPGGIGISSGPWICMGLNPKRTVVKGAFCRRSIEMERWGQHLVFECEKGFDHASGTGTGQEMADHRFDRSDGALARRPVQFPPEISQTLKFHGVSHRCSGRFAMIDSPRKMVS